MPSRKNHSHSEVHVAVAATNTRDFRVIVTVARGPSARNVTSTHFRLNPRHFLLEFECKQPGIEHDWTRARNWFGTLTRVCMHRAVQKKNFGRIQRSICSPLLSSECHLSFGKYIRPFCKFVRDFDWVLCFLLSLLASFLSSSVCLLACLFFRIGFLLFVR
jgi:hypothetical protein